MEDSVYRVAHELLHLAAQDSGYPDELRKVLVEGELAVPATDVLGRSISQFLKLVAKEDWATFFVLKGRLRIPATIEPPPLSMMRISSQASAP